MTIASLANAFALGSISNAKRPTASTSGSGSPDPTHMTYAEMQTFANQLFKDGKITGEQWGVLTMPLRPWHGPSTIVEDAMDTPFDHIERYHDAMAMAQRSQDYEFMKGLADILESYSKAVPVDIVT